MRFFPFSFFFLRHLGNFENISKGRGDRSDKKASFFANVYAIA